MNYLGDFAAGSTVRLMWNAFAVAGESITRATNGSIRIYKNNSNVERTSSAGITDSEDFDGLTGLNHVNIDTSNNADPGFFAAGNDYFVVLQGSVIDGKAINAMLGSFSIDNRSLQNRVPAVLVSGRMDASVGAMAANVLTASAIAADAITAAKIAPDAIGASELASDAVAEIQSGLAAAAALATAQGDLTALTGRLTSARAGYLDNLNVSGLVASSAEVTAIQNNTRVVITVPDIIESPDSGSVVREAHLFLYDSEGDMEAPDSAPTVALANQAGTVLNARLNATTMVQVGAETGHYKVVYTATAGDALEQILWTFTVAEGGQTRMYGRQTQLVDTSAVDFTASDRANLEAIVNKLPTNPYLAGTTDAAGEALLEDSAANLAVIANGLAAYDAPAKADLAGAKNEIITHVIVNRNDIGAIKAKTDQLTFAGGRFRATLDGETVGANLIQISGSPAVDSIPVADMFRNIIAALQGDVERDGNTYRFKNQQGATVFSYIVSNSGRVEG